MNIAKSLSKSALAAAGNPPLVQSKVFHPMERDPLNEYGVELTEESLKRLEELPIAWKDHRALVKLLDSADGITFTVKNDNEKHKGATIKATKEGFFVSVGIDWKRIPSFCNTLILPTGIGRLCFRFVLAFNTRTKDDRKTVQVL